MILTMQIYGDFFENVSFFKKKMLKKSLVWLCCYFPISWIVSSEKFIDFNFLFSADLQA